MKYDGIIFDFNGTLFFDVKYHVYAFDQCSMEICGRHVTEEIMDREFSGMPNTETFFKMSGNKFSYEECERYSRKKEQLYRDAVRNDPDTARLAPGAEEMFDALQKHHVPFTIASASIIENITFFMEFFHLDRWLKLSDIVYDDGSYKDKINMFKDAQKRLNIEHPLIFEDSLSGIRCASELGADLVIVESENLKPFYDQYPSIIKKVHDYTDILPFLEENVF